MSKRTALKNFAKIMSPSPGMTAILVMCLVVAVSAYLRSRGASELDPRVTQEAAEGSAPQSTLQAAPVRLAAFGAEDPSARYADRLREGSALTMSLSLHILNELFTNKRALPTLEAALDDFAKSPLLPPGLSVVSPKGVVGSQHGLYYVKYRPRPFGVEVTSVGARGQLDGPVFLIRLPESTPLPFPGLPASRQMVEGAALFVAPNGDAPVPLPFAPAAAYARAGWKREPFRANPLSPEQWADMQAWLALSLKQN